MYVCTSYSCTKYVLIERASASEDFVPMPPEPDLIPGSIFVSLIFPDSVDFGPPRCKYMPTPPTE